MAISLRKLPEVYRLEPKVIKNLYHGDFFRDIYLTIIAIAIPKGISIFLMEGWVSYSIFYFSSFLVLYVALFLLNFSYSFEHDGSFLYTNKTKINDKGEEVYILSSIPKDLIY